MMHVNLGRTDSRFGASHSAADVEMVKDSSAVDATTLGKPAPASVRLSLREEIMDQKMDSKVQAHCLTDHTPQQSFKVFHPDTAKAMHLQGQELWSGETDPQRQARLEDWKPNGQR